MIDGRLGGRLGLNVPYEWWPAPDLVHRIAAAGFVWVQVPAPPLEVMTDGELRRRHGSAVRAALHLTGVRSVLHGPGRLVAGTPAADRALEGVLRYAAEAGCEQVVYHAANHAIAELTRPRLAAEAGSLRRLGRIAEYLNVRIALENLAPVFPGPELPHHDPALIAELCDRVGLEAVGTCIDVGHAHLIADRRGVGFEELIAPMLERCNLVHAHDNLGVRRAGSVRPASLDPLRLDLHLPPGAGTLPWVDVTGALLDTGAPILLEVHPPHRPGPEALGEVAEGVLLAAATSVERLPA
jgi:sugar phosphate isomerase/epimerase